jgi:hypothetical protein
MNGLGAFPNANGVEEPRWYHAPHYHAEPLKNCIVENMTALLNFQDREHKVTVCRWQLVIFRPLIGTLLRLI